MAGNSRSLPKPRLSLRQQDARLAWLLLIPSLVVILGVTLWPIITTFVLSFFIAPTGINQEKPRGAPMGALIPGVEEIGCTQANYGGCKGGVQRLGNYPDFDSHYGALDMSGNLWEWVSDVYPGTTDYMLKGGDWRTLAWGGAACRTGRPLGHQGHLRQGRGRQVLCPP